jgi:hypothetical protein
VPTAVVQSCAGELCGGECVAVWLHKAEPLIRVLLPELFRIDVNVIIDLLLIERALGAMLFDCSILLFALAASVTSGWWSVYRS